MCVCLTEKEEMILFLKVMIDNNNQHLPCHSLSVSVKGCRAWSSEVDITS